MLHDLLISAVMAQSFQDLVFMSRFDNDSWIAFIFLSNLLVLSIWKPSIRPIAFATRKLCNSRRQILLDLWYKCIELHMWPDSPTSFDILHLPRHLLLSSKYPIYTIRHYSQWLRWYSPIIIIVMLQAVYSLIVHWGDVNHCSCNVPQYMPMLRECSFKLTTGKRTSANVDISLVFSRRYFCAAMLCHHTDVTTTSAEPWWDYAHYAHILPRAHFCLCAWSPIASRHDRSET